MDVRSLLSRSHSAPVSHRASMDVSPTPAAASGSLPTRIIISGRQAAGTMACAQFQEKCSFQMIFKVTLNLEVSKIGLRYINWLLIN
jgi:hypothetical protein